MIPNLTINGALIIWDRQGELPMPTSTLPRPGTSQPAHLLVVIAVVDTEAQIAPGVSGNIPTHPDLEANLWVNPGETPSRALQFLFC